jgi:hypothetical protein
MVFLQSVMVFGRKAATLAAPALSHTRIDNAPGMVLRPQRQGKLLRGRVIAARRGQRHRRRQGGKAVRNNQAALAPQKVERVGAGFIRRQQDKPERESDNQDVEHRITETLPGFSARVAMIPIQFLPPELQGCLGNVAAGPMQSRGLVPQKQ